MLLAHGGSGLAPYTLLLILLILYTTTTAAKTLSNSSAFPLPHTTNHFARDPSIIEYNNTYYNFQTSRGIEYFKASNLSGPWESVGRVLGRKPSVIGKEDSTSPWAPTVIQYNNTFYCFYCVSKLDTRNSSIGVATSDSLEEGSWTDHGALINTVSGQYADVHPYTVSNALDPSVIVDSGGQAWLTFGSYWTDIWQVPLSDDLMSVENASKPNASHLSMNSTFTAQEGSWISYKAPYYYLWYSKGYCCEMDKNDLPAPGTEYSIRVGRSLHVSGPYLDKENTSLLDGGGSLVYGSNHNGEVFAPGSSGVLSVDSGSDVLFYHYLNTSVGISDGDALLGYNYLNYDDGWPTVLSGNHDESDLTNINSSGSRIFSSPHILILCIIFGISWLL